MNHDLIMGLLEKLMDFGYIGIAFALMVEVIPSELVLSYAGFLVQSDRIHFIGALIAGVVGGTLAQVFLYLLGMYGGRPFFEKYGKYLLIQPKHLDGAEEWFQKYGTIVIFTARFIPVVRHAISIPAGIGRMSFSVFCLYTFAAMIPWTVLFLFVGIELGTHWEHIEVIGGKYIKPIALIAVIATALYFLFVFKKNKNKG